jgi:hypothetical protein
VDGLFSLYCDVDWKTCLIKPTFGLIYKIYIFLITADIRFQACKIQYGGTQRNVVMAVNSIYLPATITFSHLAVKKWSLVWATCEQWHQPSTPFPSYIVLQFQSLCTPSPRGLITTPYITSVSVPLYAITAWSITNQCASSGVGIGFTFLPHVIIPDKRHGVHCVMVTVSIFSSLFIF